VLAAGVAVAVTVTRGNDSRSIVSGLTGGSPSTPGATATTSPPTTTATAPAPSEPPRPVQRTPGNLLANGDFELDLGGWRPTGGAQVDRVAVGHSGGWSVRIRAGGPATQATTAGARPGVLAAQAVQGKTGRSYEASAWVRATSPGMEAILKLRELGGDGDSADVIGVTLVDAGWHEIAVVHEVQAGGRLTVEAMAGNLRPGEAFLVDQVSITAA
jgi:hypothetical protein